MNYSNIIKLTEEIVRLSRAVFFHDYYGDENLSLEDEEKLLRETLINGEVLNAEETERFMSSLETIRSSLQTDVVAAFNGDPAAQSYDEVICCYPVIKALMNYRIAHELHQMGIQLIPRLITEMAHSETGIDIHPGAQIGDYFTIDHGTGVVIGETSIIGNNVKLYQGVTLGSRSFPLDDKGHPIKGILRHPILEDDVIVYANSTILGRIIIGKGAIIGGNVWVTDDVKPGDKVVQRISKE